jgi:hypothetical protein
MVTVAAGQGDSFGATWRNMQERLLPSHGIGGGRVGLLVIDCVQFCAVCYVRHTYIVGVV